MATLVAAATFGAVLTLPATALAQANPAAAGGRTAPPQAIVSLYRVAPGQHLAFLKWMAAQEEISKAAGVAASKWYAHTDGDQWDYMVVSPITTPAQDAKIEELSKSRGAPSGLRGSLEFRKYMAWHTDTYVAGPMTVAELVSAAGGM